MTEGVVGATNNTAIAEVVDPATRCPLFGVTRPRPSRNSGVGFAQFYSRRAGGARSINEQRTDFFEQANSRDLPTPGSPIAATI